MKVHFTTAAKEAALEKATWWKANRDKAPKLFIEELRAATLKLRGRTDDTRKRYRISQGCVVWRLLMPKTKNHIYYVINEEAKQIEVLTVWNAVGKAPPKSILETS